MSSRLRLLFGHQPEWRHEIMRRTNKMQFDAAMQPLAEARLQGFDVVVPLFLGDHRHLERQVAAGVTVPAVLVPAAVQKLCHDKPALNRRLIELGFGDHVPAMLDALPDDLAAQPVIVKPRSGAWGRDAMVLDGGPVPEVVQGWLKAGTHFIQALMPGHHERSTHLLMHRGHPMMWATAVFDMGKGHRVKGVAASPRQIRWLDRSPDLDLWLRMLRAIGFTDGTCCIDHRMVQGRAMLFEINPRYGASLVQQINPYLRAYAACVGAG